MFAYPKVMKIFFSRLSCRSLIVLPLTFVSVKHPELIWGMVQDSGQNSHIPRGSPIDLAPFVKTTALPQLLAKCHFCRKSSIQMYMDLFLNVLACFILIFLYSSFSFLLSLYLLLILGMGVCVFVCVST